MENKIENKQIMFRGIPMNNKICFDKQLKRSWMIHQNKLKNIKSTVNSSPPHHYSFLNNRSKKSQIQNVRNIEIQKQNNCLLSKIKNICEKGCKNSYLKNTQNTSHEKKKTLNQESRKRQMVKIVQQNQEILKRISQSKSSFNTKKWQKQRKQIQKNITLISQFPYKNYRNTQTKVNLWMTQQASLSRSKVKYQKQRLSTGKKVMNRSNLKFNGTVLIADSYYLISTYFQKKNFVAEIQNIQILDQKYRLVLPESEAFQILNQSFDGNIYLLLSSLQIDPIQKTCLLKTFTDNS